MMVTFGTSASTTALRNRPPRLMMPPFSCSTPGMKPGVSTTNTSGGVERVAEPDEPGRLVGGLVVDGARHVHRLVGDHADRPAVDAGERR